MKDLGRSETFLNPHDVSRSLGCPGRYPSLFLKKLSARVQLRLLHDVLEEVLRLLRERATGKARDTQSGPGWDRVPNSWSRRGTN